MWKYNFFFFLRKIFEWFLGEEKIPISQLYIQPIIIIISLLFIIMWVLRINSVYIDLLIQGSRDSKFLKKSHIILKWVILIMKFWVWESCRFYSYHDFLFHTTKTIAITFQNCAWHCSNEIHSNFLSLRSIDEVDLQ